ncbi:NLE (NUC135) domain-containing protein [Spironucleus salmonicida]|uniref:NLE (NUC135) domain-containing protein n=1 Tax=Spironucleus salmonicida TaxID=348837 RepID=V6LJ61_9EUKA|nr:NLE (NUC135) domain-containing protein [Spironucleus salmonicida]|eukprot:EST44383.1 NLE (NUC135) domain-containing protein [Spironucleus salmonicida]
MSTLTVSLFSLDRDIQIDETPLVIPQATSIIDLNELANSLTSQPQTFDFYINDLLVSLNLTNFLNLNNISIEQTVKIACAPSPIPPVLKNQQDIPDWGSSLSISDTSIYVTSYDGSVQIFDKTLKPLQSIQLSKQPLTCSVFNKFHFSAGYDGTINVLDGEKIQKFKSASQTPIVSMNTFKDGIFAFDEASDVYLLDLQIVENQQIQPAFSLAQHNPTKAFEFQGNLALSCSNSVKFYDIIQNQIVSSIPGPEVSCFAYDENIAKCGSFDRAIRVYDLRAGNQVQRTFLGHKSHVVKLTQRGKGHFFSTDISGVSYLWDERCSRPYHSIECYDREMDKKNDQGRVLDAICDDHDLYMVGSARKIFQYGI